MPAKAIRNKDILVICIDRDDDLGKKAGINGPVVGRAANMDAAIALGLKDPSESDVNAIFYAIKVYGDLKAENTVEIVTLTGDTNIGIVSDKKILAQLDEVLRTHSFKEAVLVSDGAEDEHILPRLRTKINIISTQQVIVKQSAPLESTYYVINDFIRDALSDKKTAHLFFGVPAVAMILYSIFGMAAWRLILGVVGVYLLIRGFKVEHHLMNAYNIVLLAAKKRQPSFFLYILGASVSLIALFLGYDAASRASGILEETLFFFNASIFVLFVAFAFILCARSLPLGRIALLSCVTYVMLSFASAWIIYEVTRFGISHGVGYGGIAYSIIFSGVLVAVSILVEKRAGRRRK